MAFEDRIGKDVGEFNQDGSIKADAVVCAFSGRNCKGIHAVRERIRGTRYFYRILTDVYESVTDGWRAEFARPFLTGGEPVQPKESKSAREGRRAKETEDVTDDSI